MEPSEESIPIGLGWGRPVHHDNDPKGSRTTRSLQTTTPPEGVVDLYLQQCLEYHQQQEIQRQRASDFTIERSFTNDPKEVLFVKADEPLVMVHDDDYNDNPPAASAPLEAPRDPESFAERVEQGRARAQDILDRFLRQQTALLGSTLASPTTSTDPLFQQSSFSVEIAAASTPIPAIPVIPEYEPLVRAFVDQRQKGLQRERHLKEQALARNLDYVARREAQRAQALADEIESARRREELLRHQHDAALQERMRLQRESLLMHSSAAIGSQERKKVEHVKRKVLATTGNNDSALDSGASVALYLSGIPIDGSVDEKFLRQLFGSYGVIRKVRLYRNKQTGELKGDGLIVYQVNHGVAPRDLLSEVCSQSISQLYQMNGAELPCGSVLLVEPADSSYNQPRLDFYGSSCGASAPRTDDALPPPDPGPESPAKPGKGDDEDLDDFFNSI